MAQLIKNKPIRLSAKTVLFIIIALAFAIRLYYFITSGDQAMWWDEAEYMSTAKHWALGVPYELNEQRPPLFQLFAALLIRLGLGELALKFILVLVPSLILVAVVYYMGKEFFEPRIGLFAAAGAALVWSLVFWSIRFQPDFFSVIFQLTSLLFFWKLVKSDSRKHAIYAGLFAALAFYFKISALLVPLSMIVFALYKDGWKLFKQKNYWVLIGAFIVGLVPFMLWQWIMFGSPLAFGETYSGDFNTGRSLGWMTLDFYPHFAKIVVLVLFIVGLAMTLIKTVMTLDRVVKNKSFRLDPYMFSFIVLLVVTSFYIFYIKGVIEDRWVFLIIPFMLFFAGRATFAIYDLVRKYSKFFAIILMAILIFSFAIPQLSHTTKLIKEKEKTYAPVKESALIIKENSEPTDKIFSISYTQTTAYSEREVITYSNMPMENFTKVLHEERPRFIVVSLLEPHHPPWILRQAQNEQGYRGLLFEYFNSSIIFSPQGELVSFDLKNKVERDGAVFTRIYPTNNFEGLVVYKIDYVN